MPFIPYIPHFPLSQFIDCLWYVTGQTNYTREKVLPAENIELIINLAPIILADHFNKKQQS